MSSWYEREEEQRRWRRMIEDMVADEQAAKLDPPAEQSKPVEKKHERLPAHPSSLRSVHRLSIEDQDEWSTRMKNAYGGEW